MSVLDLVPKLSEYDADRQELELFRAVRQWESDVEVIDCSGDKCRRSYEDDTDDEDDTEEEVTDDEEDEKTARAWRNKYKGRNLHCKACYGDPIFNIGEYVRLKLDKSFKPKFKWNIVYHGYSR